MAANRTLQQVLDDAAQIINTWKENPDFALGTIQRTDLETLITQIQAEEAAIEAQRTKLTGMIQERDIKADTLSDYTTRARGGFKSVYGADSKQYKQAGGTITSERKSRMRKPKASEPH